MLIQPCRTIFQLVTEYQQNLGYTNPQFGQANNFYQPQQQQEQQQSYQTNNQQFTAQQQQQPSSQQALTNQGLVAYFQQVHT